MILYVFFLVFPWSFPRHSPTRGAVPEAPDPETQLRVALGDILAVHLVPEPAARGTWTPHNGLSSKLL